MALIPPFYLDCVVAIGSEEKGGIHWGATGFLYGQRMPEQEDPAHRPYAVYLVTNRHVLQDMKRAVLRFNPVANGAAREYDLALVDRKGSPLWLAHPHRGIDIAVAPINFPLLKRHAMQVTFFESDSHALTSAKMRRHGITEGDFAYVLGFPMGLVGGKRNSVIVRSGTIARIRDMLAGSEHDFLLDTLVFPGNSGGPVILKPEATAIEGSTAHPKAFLIGIVSAYMPYTDIALSAQTQHPRVIFEENSGLASALPMDYVQQTVRRHLRQLRVGVSR